MMRKHPPIPPIIIQRKFGALRILISVYDAKDRMRTPTRNLNTFNKVIYSFIQSEVNKKQIIKIMEHDKNK